jgi:gas vesicle protein GvpA/GvpJ/GvpM family
MGSEMQLGRHQASGLVDVLDRVLDKGLVIAGDIKVSLAEVELLTVRIRLIVCSIDKAQEIGLDWWKYDHHLAPGRHVAELENERLKETVRLLERKVESLTRRTPAARRKAARNNGT